MTNDYNTMVAVTDIRLSGGKWYWEMKPSTLAGSLTVGVVREGYNPSEVCLHFFVSLLCTNLIFFSFSIAVSILDV